MPRRDGAGPVRAFRLIAPVLVPFMLGSVCFAILVLLGLAAPDALPLAIGVEGLGPIFFVYAAVGVVLAAALAYAPSDAIWALAMIVGLIAFGAITTWAIFGPLVALTLLLGLSALLAVVVRRQMHTVLEDTVHVMVLFGKHNRILRPGFNLRWPFEQVWAIINTAEVTVEVAAREVTLLGGTRLHISATTACRAMPERAHLTAPHAHEWVDHVRRCLELTLRETLSEMEPEEICPTDGSLPGDALNVRLRGRLQQIVGGWGISVTWVRAHTLAPVATAPDQSRVGSTPDVASGPHAAIAALRRPGVATPGTAAVAPPPDVAVVRGLTPGALLPLPPAMRAGVPVPEALADAYAAVRERRITDPTTIARIARAFDTIARDPVLSPHLPFDAHEAARNLRALAHQLTGRA